MAKYRQLYTEFWSDSFVLELTPEEKYFYLYLISNSKTTQCGIYEISKRIMESETGYNRETVEKLISRFCDYNKILYCETTKELMVINWIKYNVPNNQNSKICVNRELGKVKNKEFIKILFEKCQEAKLDVEKIFENLIIEGYDTRTYKNFPLEKVDKPSVTFTLESSSQKKNVQTDNIPSKASKDFVEVTETQESSEFLINKPNSMDLQGPYNGLISNRIRSNKEEVRSNKQKSINKEEAVSSKKEIVMNYENDSDGLKAIIKIFEENVHAITPLEYQKILDFQVQVSSKVIIMAIEEAVIYNAKTIKYIAEILNSWISHGVKTAEDVREYQKKWANKKINSLNENVKKGGFCDYEQRTYDYAALEKRLLGYADAEDNDNTLDLE